MDISFMAVSGKPLADHDHYLLEAIDGSLSYFRGTIRGLQFLLQDEQVSEKERLAKTLYSLSQLTNEIADLLKVLRGFDVR